MKLSLSQAAPDTLMCEVTALGFMRRSAEAIATWKRQPVVVAGEPLAASFLRHSEDQTVLALQTVLSALEEAKLDSRSCADWGIVAAANFFGRLSIAQSMERYQTEGAWGISPHFIPHQSLHAISGTISQALKIYGPNFGVGGGPNASADAFLLAAALMADGQLPGLWLILTGHDAEVIPIRNERRSDPPPCLAMVMALRAAGQRGAGLRLAIGQTAVPGDGQTPARLPEFQLGALREDETSTNKVPSGKWRLSDTHWIELATTHVEQETAA